MKADIKKELHSKDLGELEKKVQAVLKDLSKMKMDHQMGKVKNTSDLTLKRREIAVLKTIINEKRILGETKGIEKVEKEKKTDKSKGGNK